MLLIIGPKRTDADSSDELDARDRQVVRKGRSLREMFVHGLEAGRIC